MYQRAKQRLTKKALVFAALVSLLSFGLGIFHTSPEPASRITWTDQMVKINKVGNPGEPDAYDDADYPVYVRYRTSNHKYKHAWTKLHANWSSSSGEPYEGDTAEFCVGSNGQLIDMGSYSTLNDTSCPPPFTHITGAKKVGRFGIRALKSLGPALALGLLAFWFFRIFGAKLWLNAFLVGWVRFRWIKAFTRWGKLRKERLELDKTSGKEVALVRTIADLEMFPEGVITPVAMGELRRELETSRLRKYDMADIVLSAALSAVQEDRQRDAERLAELQQLG